MKRAASMKLEDWNTIFQFASAVLLGLTFAVGAGAIITGYFLGKNQAERIAGTEHAAAEANKRAAEAGEGTAKALADAASANERAGKLELEASSQRARAAKAEHDLLVLQQRLASRRIGANEHSALVASLKPFAGSTVEITRLGDSEAGQFADDLIQVFTESGWNLRTRRTGMIAPPAYGLSCSVNEESAAGKAVAAALRTLPTAHIQSSPNLAIVARVLVGLKPPP